MGRKPGRCDTAEEEPSQQQDAKRCEGLAANTNGRPA